MDEYTHLQPYPNIWRKRDLHIGSIHWMDSLKLNSNGRHVSVYFAVYPTLVLAFHVAGVDCKLQLGTRPRGLQSTRASRQWQTSTSVDNGVWRRPIVVAVQLQLRHATATSRSCNCNVAFSPCVNRHRLLDSIFFFFFAGDTGVKQRQTLMPTAFCRSCEMLTATLYKTNEIYLPSARWRLFSSHADVRVSWHLGRKVDGTARKSC